MTGLVTGLPHCGDYGFLIEPILSYLLAVPAKDWSGGDLLFVLFFDF
jgi:hypothetical protein